jgi:hypothetical protein
VVEVILLAPEHCLHGRRRMEHLWSRAEATGGKRAQIEWPQERLEQAKTVATDCGRLPIGAHGKGGSTVRVRQRALQKSRKSGLSRFLCRTSLHRLQYAVGMEPFVELPGWRKGFRARPEVTCGPAEQPASMLG